MSLDQLEQSEQVFAAQPNLVFACTTNKKGLGIKVSGKEMAKECSLIHFIQSNLRRKLLGKTTYKH